MSKYCSDQKHLFVEVLTCEVRLGYPGTNYSAGWSDIEIELEYSA